MTIFVLMVGVLEMAFEHFGYCYTKSLGGSSNLDYMYLRMENFASNNCSHIELVLTKQIDFSFGIQPLHGCYDRSHWLPLDLVDHFAFLSYQAS